MNCGGPWAHAWCRNVTGSVRQPDSAPLAGGHGHLRVASAKPVGFRRQLRLKGIRFISAARQIPRNAYDVRNQVVIIRIKQGKLLAGVISGKGFTKWGKIVEISLNGVICVKEVKVGGKKRNSLILQHSSEWLIDRQSMEDEGLSTPNWSFIHCCYASCPRILAFNNCSSSGSFAPLSSWMYIDKREQKSQRTAQQTSERPNCRN